MLILKTLELDAQVSLTSSKNNLFYVMILSRAEDYLVIIGPWDDFYNFHSGITYIYQSCDVDASCFSNFTY